MQKTFFILAAALLFVTGCGNKTPNDQTPLTPLSSETNNPTTSEMVIPTETFVPSVMVERYKDVENCEGREDWQDCYANVALHKNDPSLCFKMEPGLDDVCLQYYYLQKNDPKVCDTLPKKGIQKTCEKYYKNLK